MRDNQWQPSGKMLLSIKQLGIPEAFVQSKLADFYCEAHQNNDRAFLQWIYHEFLATHRDGESLLHRYTIPTDWQPSDDDIESLQKEGYVVEIVRHYVITFVANMIEAKVIRPSWSAAFKRFIKKKLLPIKPCFAYDDWQLNSSVRYYLMRVRGYKAYHINDNVELFRSLAKQKCYPLNTLDTLFMQFLQSW
jgi:hypothetical protein